MCHEDLCPCPVMWQEIDSFTVSLHSPNGWHLPAIGAVQKDCQWPLKNGGNCHWSCKPTIHCDWCNPNWYLHQPHKDASKYHLMTIQIYSSGIIWTISSANWPLEFGSAGMPKCMGNHTYLGLTNNWGMQSKNGLQNLWGNIMFCIMC